MREVYVNYCIDKAISFVDQTMIFSVLGGQISLKISLVAEILWLENYVYIGFI